MAADSKKSLRDLLIKGLMLCFLGAIVLVSPVFIHSSALNEAVGGSSVVGWFSLVLGIAFLAQWARRRNRF